MPAYSFPSPPAALTGQPSQVNGTLTYHFRKAEIHSFGTMLSPGYYRRKTP